MNTLLFLDLGVGSLIWALLYPALAIYCLVDIVRANFKDSTTKILWVLIVLFAPFIGSIAYLIAGRGSKI